MSAVILKPLLFLYISPLHGIALHMCDIKMK